MLDNQKWTKLVQKLNEQTQDGRLKWSKIDVTPTNALLKVLVDPASSVYTAFYKEKGFKISRMASVQSKYVTTIALEIIDANGSAEWKVPDVVGISDLYQTVKMQSSGVGQFIEDFLEE